MGSITHTADLSGAHQPQRFVQLVAGTAALAGLLFGFDTGVISGAILFIKGAFGLSPFAEEVLVSAALVGAVCGSTLSGRFTDVLGRKRASAICELDDRCGSWGFLSL
jgi:MFS family permease